MQQQVDNIEKKVEKMYEAFIGNEFNDGLISEVKSNTKHRKNSFKVNGFIAGLAIVIGGAITKFLHL
jgi:hypothetical protein